MAEKTKLQLLEELNRELEKKVEGLEKENKDLVEDIRAYKSASAEIEANLDKLNNYGKLKIQCSDLQKALKEKAEQIAFQNQQISILFNGLNQVADAINKLFVNLDYSLGLAKQNYESIFANVQNQLNGLNKKEEGDEK